MSLLGVSINGGRGITSEDDLNEEKEKRDEVIERIMDRLYGYAEKQNKGLRERQNDYSIDVVVNVK